MINKIRMYSFTFNPFVNVEKKILFMYNVCENINVVINTMSKGNFLSLTVTTMKAFPCLRVH